MKKFIAVSMVALLAVTSVFAGFSGSASAGLVANIDKEEYGFTGAAGNFTLTFDADTLAGGSKGEGKVYAEVGATATVATGAFEDVPGLDKAPVATVASISLDKLAVVGENWSVDLLNVQGAVNFASDWTKGSDKKVSNLDFALAAVPGVTVDVYGYKVGAGFWHNETGTAALLSLNSKKFDFDGFTVEAGVATAKAAAAGVVGLDASAKLGYTLEDLALTVGSDVVLNIPTEEGAEVSVDADVALTVAYNPVTVNAYYATNAVNGYAADSTGKNYYTVGLALDLKDLLAPVTLNVNVLNVQQEKGKITADTAYSFEGGKVSANGGYDFGKKAWNIGADAEYTFENVGKLNGGFALAENAEKLTLNVGFENTTLINNATLNLGYASGNLLAEKAEIGAFNAGITVAF